MATFLFDKTIFGPVKSRRLGSSLGINLLPNTGKICSFNCIYCECGWTEKSAEKLTLPTKEVVLSLLKKRLKELSDNAQCPDAITFAGNGEPTLHPHFDSIVEGIVVLRDQFCPNAKITLLSNATTIQRAEVRNALRFIDKNIMKLDSGIEATCRLLNKPMAAFSLSKLISELKRINHNLIIQTMFIKGDYEGYHIDNTTDEEVTAWLEQIREINPTELMIYTIERNTPVAGLEKVPLAKLNEIAKKTRHLGFKTTVSA